MSFPAQKLQQYTAEHCYKSPQTIGILPQKCIENTSIQDSCFPCLYPRNFMSVMCAVPERPQYDHPNSSVHIPVSWVVSGYTSHGLMAMRPCAQSERQTTIKPRLENTLPRRSKQLLVPQHPRDLRPQTPPYEGPTPPYEGPRASGCKRSSASHYFKGQTKNQDLHPNAPRI